MKPLLETVANPSGLDSLSNYAGQTDFGQLYCLVAQNRDSDCLSRSNFRSALKALGGESEDVEIHRFNHWACGWWEALAVKQGTEAFAKAERIEAALENYPVVDEDDFSNLESEEAGEVWKSCYQPNERVEYIRKHRNQFYFSNFADMLGCVRGQYFAGYASELLS